MDKFKTFILALGTLFFIFLVLIGSGSGIVQMIFMMLVYFFRKPLRHAIRKIATKNLILVVFFGVLLGLSEEVLWYMFEPGVKQTMFKSLYADLAATFPAYLFFYLIVYALAKKRKITQKSAFLYGGIFGYIFYFIFESGIFGTQFGGVSGAPVWLILVWEINNFFLNGLLVWFPLYLSDILVDKE